MTDVTRPHAGNLDWDEMLKLHASPDPWVEEHQDEEFFDAAVEAGELADGESHLSKSVTLNGGLAIRVRYLGEGSTDQGDYWHSFLFSGPGFDALIGVTDDPARTKLVRRGDADAFCDARLWLKMFKGRTLAHLRTEDE